MKEIEELPQLSSLIEQLLTLERLIASRKIGFNEYNLQVSDVINQLDDIDDAFRNLKLTLSYLNSHINKLK